MTLEIGDGVEVKTWWDNTIHITTSKRNSEVSMKDFLAAAYYVLVNSNLLENDPRLDFTDIVKELVVSQGYDKTQNRLVYRREDKTFSLMYPGLWDKGDR